MSDTTATPEPAHSTSTEPDAPWVPSADPDPAAPAEEGWAAEFDEAPKEDSLLPPEPSDPSAT